MRVITVISDELNYGFANFLKPSAETHQLDLVVLHVKPEIYNDNHRYKDKILYQYLAGIDNDEIIFFTDGYDAMFLSGEEEMLNKFHKTKKKLLFSGEINCWPDPGLSKKYPQSNERYRYLCSGGFIGNAGYIKKMIEEKLDTDSIRKYPRSNQVYWSEQFLRNQSDIGIDTQCEIFLTLATELDLEFIRRVDNNENWDAVAQEKMEWFHKNFYMKNERLNVMATNSTPCHLHANGMPKLLAVEIVKEWNLIS